MQGHDRSVGDVVGIKRVISPYAPIKRRLEYLHRVGERLLEEGHSKSRPERIIRVQLHLPEQFITQDVGNNHGAVGGDGEVQQAAHFPAELLVV